jgi:hypothetical protein
MLGSSFKGLILGRYNSCDVSIGLCIGIDKGYVGLYKGYTQYVGLGKVYVRAT